MIGRDWSRGATNMMMVTMLKSMKRWCGVAGDALRSGQRPTAASAMMLVMLTGLPLDSTFAETRDDWRRVINSVDRE